MGDEVTFGSWLKQRRKELGVAQEELAEQIGCSEVMLRKLEAGERHPSGQVAQLLADYLRISDDEREAFVTAASQIVLPVVAIDGRPIGDGKPGPIATALRREFHRYAEAG